MRYLSASGHARGVRREQQRWPRFCPGRAGAGSGRAGRVVPSGGQQGGPDPLELRYGTALPPLPEGVAHPVARAPCPPDDLPAAVPGQPLARCGGCGDRDRRARSLRPRGQAPAGRAFPLTPAGASPDPSSHPAKKSPLTEDCSVGGESYGFYTGCGVPDRFRSST